MLKVDLPIEPVDPKIDNIFHFKLIYDVINNNPKGNQLLCRLVYQENLRAQVVNFQYL